MGNYTYNLIKALAEADKKNEYILYFNWLRWRKVKPTFNYSNFRDAINRIPAKVQRVLHNNFRLPIELFIGKTDIFHSPNYFLPPTRRAKTVVTIHDLSPKLFPETRIQSDTAYFNRWVPISINSADKVIVDSISTKKDLVKWLNVQENKIKVIYPGVGKEFCPIENSVTLEIVRKKYNLPHKFILYLGTLEPRKNLPRLFEAYHKITSHKGVEHNLVVAGGRGWLYDEIFASVKKLGLDKRVTFTDFIAEGDLPALYSLANLFVFPSLYEGFGLPPLEATACGTPVITSNTSSLPEIVGNAGILIDPNDAESLAQAMYTVLTDKELRQELKTKGLKRAKMFSWEKTARETLRVYEEVYKSSR